MAAVDAVPPKTYVIVEGVVMAAVFETVEYQQQGFKLTVIVEAFEYPLERAATTFRVYDVMAADVHVVE